ncbi:MAG: DNA primase [Candidatus Iainarchaeum archaeon]|uniref:DNA primase DnaG n=1 Tax=Candidatus Iainarchaeum sp. TaxID=3101447 RepID=A0A497JGS1_9ARCH|nr:MAG: DNA primase [Candidatus Diapherotrites archaeon]
MAKTYINATKYEISAVFRVEGVVDRHDVVGAIFGQSEGLLGEDLDLRELQKNGKIGRIEITTAVQNGVTTGRLIVPSSLDMVETCILGAAIETVDKVGPCRATFKVVSIKDTRAKKRELIIDRAQELLEKMVNEQIPETEELVRIVRERVRTSGIVDYGPDRLPAGDEIENADTIIVVEGRADVLTLLKNNIRNVIGMDGSKISQTIVELCNRKKVIAFVDGDRGGELILRKLAQLAKVDFVARAPEGKEVEELTRKEIIMALRKKMPLSEFMKKEQQRIEKSAMPSEAERFKPIMESLRGTLKAKVFDKNLKELATVNVRELLKSLEKFEGAKIVVLDGIITKRLAETAKKQGVEYLVGAKIGKIGKAPEKIKLLALE